MDAVRAGPAEPGTVEARLGRLRRQARELSVHIDSLTHAYEHAADGAVVAHLEYLIQLKSQRLNELSTEKADLERTLAAARVPAGGGDVEHTAARRAPYPDALDEPGDPDGANGPGGPAGMPGPRPGDADADGDPGPASWMQSAGERTRELINHGRRTSAFPRLSRRGTISIVAAVLAVLITVVVTVLVLGGASWPDSVATVQNDANRACQNPNLESEPNQVNFACAKATRQVLWVFALLTSDNNPKFVDAQTHRLGLEPIQPAEGGEVAWSLNLHHPYNPDNPIDSLAVAARAINNIVGGATLTGTNGSPVVQPGLESDPANCLRYTGSAALRSHNGFPSLCARPVASPAGQAALVADVYKKWIVGATQQAAQDAAVLYQNVNNPGDPRVQAILKQLQSGHPRA